MSIDESIGESPLQAANPSNSALARSKNYVIAAKQLGNKRYANETAATKKDLQ